MDEATTRAMLKQFYETTADDVTGASEIYADAALEFPQGNERIRARPTSSPSGPPTRPMSPSRCTG
jgi:hypothetical protein